MTSIYFSADIKFLKKEFVQMKVENKQLQKDNKRLREKITDINQTVEELRHVKKEKDATVLKKCDPSLSSSGHFKRLLLPAGNFVDNLKSVKDLLG